MSRVRTLLDYQKDHDPKCLLSFSPRDAACHVEWPQHFVSFYQWVLVNIKQWCKSAETSSHVWLAGIVLHTWIVHQKMHSLSDSRNSFSRLKALIKVIHFNWQCHTKMVWIVTEIYEPEDQCCRSIFDALIDPSGNDDIVSSFHISVLKHWNHPSLVNKHIARYTFVTVGKTNILSSLLPMGNSLNKNSVDEVKQPQIQFVVKK